MKTIQKPPMIIITIYFSFFQYGIGLHPSKIINAIMFYSNNPNIVETKGIYGWIRSLYLN